MQEHHVSRAVDVHQFEPAVFLSVQINHKNLYTVAADWNELLQYINYLFLANYVQCTARTSSQLTDKRMLCL